MTKLGITRGADRLAELIGPGAECGFEIVALPLTESKIIDFDLPDEPSLEQIDWLFFTSARAVGVFCERISQSGAALPDTTRIAVVGRKTAAALSPFGYKADFTPRKSSGEALFTEFIDAHGSESISALYVSARNPRYDPEALFTDSNVRLDRLSVYETAPLAEAPEVASEFTEDDYILFTAPSAAAAYQEFLGPPRATCIALGDATVSAIKKLGWPAPIVMPEAEIGRVFEYVRQPLTHRGQK
ncbi:MAG: uroporphyrinogen-III synthase [Candidatus Zixiibacteriota bacterium]